MNRFILGSFYALEVFIVVSFSLLALGLSLGVLAGIL